MNLPLWSIDQRDRERFQHRLVLRQLAAVDLQLQVPSEWLNARSQRGNFVERDQPALEHQHARAADADLRQALELGVAGL